MLPQKILQFDVISMEFLSLRCRRSFWWNVPSDEDTDDRQSLPQSYDIDNTILVGRDNFDFAPLSH